MRDGIDKALVGKPSGWVGPVERGILIPSPGWKAELNLRMMQLQVRESFATSQNINTVRTIARRLKMKITTRKIPHGIRVWRME